MKTHMNRLYPTSVLFLCKSKQTMSECIFIPTIHPDSSRKQTLSVVNCKLVVNKDCINHHKTS